MVKVVESNPEFKALINSNKKVIVDFHADWCGCCRTIAPKYAALSEEFKNVTFVKVNVDHLVDLATTSGVRAMPTFHSYYKGSKVGEVLGADVNKLKELIEEVNKLKELFEQAIVVA
ncbi:hypothetical protein BGZ83_001026 [Gryganskiella cystojenkinii]|nr:hypothetical protein BGZ83_001026 [Gryganskiella cystojenkinii]